MAATQIESYRKKEFSFTTNKGLAISHDIYTNGSGKKIVVIIQELPGISQKTLALADRFVARGYTVVLPHLFGPIGKKASMSNFKKVCISKEFRIFSRNESSPIVDFLSALCSSLKTEHKVKGVAVIGMCLTGNFAISLMANSDVLAGFASQPSLPLLRPGSIQIDPKKIEPIKKRLDEIGAMHCGHFVRDLFCLPMRINAIDRIFNTDDKQRIIFHKLKGWGHSILTGNFVDKKDHPTYKALQEIFEYFDEQLEASQ